MKKILALLLAGVLLLGLVACAAADEQTNSGSSSNNSTTDKENDSSCKHEWSSWSLKTEAMVDKEGIEERTCSLCGAAETSPTTENALENSFGKVDISGLLRFWMDNKGEEIYDIPYAVEAIQGVTLLSFLGYTYEGEERTGDDFEISSETAFAYLNTYFTISDWLKEDMCKDARYNAETDKFSLTKPGDVINRQILGYVHLEDNRYVVYYYAEMGSNEPSYWRIETEYNLLSGTPNRFISVIRLASAPDYITN